MDPTCPTRWALRSFGSVSSSKLNSQKINCQLLSVGSPMASARSTGKRVWGTLKSHLRTGFKCDALRDVIFQSDITRAAFVTEYFTITRGGACALLFTDCHPRHFHTRPQGGAKMQRGKRKTARSPLSRFFCARILKKQKSPTHTAYLLWCGLPVWL